MARLFRLWEKKRGERRTGSKWLGSLGEALFFAALFFLGLAALAAVITAQFLHPVPGLPVLTGWLLWLSLVVLGSFVLMGGAGVIYAVLQVNASTERRSALAKRAEGLEILREKPAAPREFPAIPRDEDITNSPGVRLAYRLPISESPAWQLLAATAFCLVWNGISAVLLVVAADGLISGRPDWWLISFSIPFAGIGCGAVYYFVQQLRVHTGIGPTNVEISDHPLVPGGAFGVYLSQAGRLSMQSLDMYLVCDEEATYHQGTDVRTECRRVFERLLLHDGGFEIREGLPFERECEAGLPGNVMHSFQGTFNAVHWKLVVRGRARGWPQYERAFPVVVHPCSNGAARPRVLRGE